MSTPAYVADIIQADTNLLRRCEAGLAAVAMADSRTVLNS